ncbi:hypothetical protein [Nocardioides pocheonensis]|uniref:Uncharacterized protein n=1 Tax=Nocardioides pocheonensis TaxID=661485 RepID=A0A3N0GIW4_9ACTN|nr:hypothetical protein [Nocardioides pocheonensis]RNM12407.1 hypothetical protein EFL26_17300 [Nocardioides pocheonensis]
MNTFTADLAKYAGACVAGIATSCVLAAPALAMQPPVPDPVPGSGEHHKIFDSLDGRGGPAPTTPTTDVGSTSDGIDWSTLGAALGGGMALVGAGALGATQIHRRQARPA